MCENGTRKEQLKEFEVDPYWKRASVRTFVRNFSTWVERSAVRIAQGCRNLVVDNLAAVIEGAHPYIASVTWQDT